MNEKEKAIQFMNEWNERNTEQDEEPKCYCQIMEFKPTRKCPVCSE